MLLLAGCGPRGILGTKWGDDADQAARALGVRGDGWTPWEGGGGFEARVDYDRRVELFGREASLRLFRVGAELVGAEARFRECSAGKDALREAIRKEFHVSVTSGDPYEVWLNNSLVHFSYNRGDDTCTLTLAGPKLGARFEAYQLARGLGELATGLHGH
jgi:hypothetical protein